MIDNNDELELDPKINDDESLLEEALERFKSAKSAWKDIHVNYVDDVKFANGEQWDENVAKIRKQENRSTMVYNKIIQNAKYILNNARMNVPAIKTSPVSGNASKNTAKIFDGIIKYIEYNSQAKNAYINALKGVTLGGIGAFRVLPEYDEYTELELVIKKIPDPTTVLVDPNASKSCFQDAEYCFVINWLDKELFRKEYPDATCDPIDDSVRDWYSKDKVQVVEYWYKLDGKFKQALITGSEVLSRDDDYVGVYMPIVFITGEEYVVDNIREFKGIVRDVKDIQRQINYSKSETADYLARTAKQQWLVEAEQIADYQDIWDSNNVSQFNYLPYKATSSAGKPDIINPAIPPSGLIESSKESEEDLRRSIGIRDPLEDLPRTSSGKAIGLQISQSNIGTYNLYDSLNEGIIYLGKILVDLIPYYYDYKDIIQIMGEDGQITTVPLNVPYNDGGEQVVHSLKSGRYAVRISSGPSYESQRQETTDRLVDLVAKYPPMMQMAGDLIVKNLNFVGADELAARLQASIPPQILAASNPSNGDNKQQLQVTQAQLAQMQQQMQMLMQENMQLKQEQATKAQAQMMKHQQEMELADTKFKHEVALREIDAKADNELEAAKMAHDVATNHIEHQTKIFEKQLDHNHAREMKRTDIRLF